MKAWSHRERENIIPTSKLIRTRRTQDLERKSIMQPSIFLIAATAAIFRSTIASRTPLDDHQHFSHLYPHIDDASHASQPLIDILNDYFKFKSLHDPERWLSHFEHIEGVYGDATLVAFLFSRT